MKRPQLPLRTKASQAIHRFADAVSGVDQRVLSQGFRPDDTSFGMQVTPYNPDSLIAKKGYEIIDKMRHDDMIRSVMTIKKFARVAPGWNIVPASDASSDQKAADFIKWNLTKLKGTFDSLLIECMTALDYGFSVGELLWGINKDKTSSWSGSAILKDIKFRRPNRIDFLQDSHGNLKEEGIVQEKLSGELDPMPTEKFLIYTYQKEFDNYYGMSDYRGFYREWWIKTVILKFWAMWLERFPFPPTIGWYPPGASNDLIGDLEAVLESLQVSSSVTLPLGVIIDQLKIPESGARQYESAIKILNKGITRAALVPDLLGFTDTSSRGSFALGKKHFDVFLWVLLSLGRELSAAFNEQVIPQLSGFNFDASSPFLEFPNPVEDLEARSKALQIWVNSGIVSSDEDWVRDYLSIPKKGQSYIRKYYDQNERLRFSESQKKGFRELTLFEEKVGFDPQGTEELWEKFVTKGSNEASKVLFNQIGRMLGSLDKMFKSKGDDEVQLKLSDRELARVMNSIMMEAYFDSKLNALQEVENSLGRKLDFSEPEGETFEFVSEDFPAPLETIRKFRNRVPMTKREWQRLSKRFRDRAFTMAGQTNLDIIEKMKQITFNAIDEGMSVSDFQQMVEKEGARYTGRSWRINLDEPIARWHTELIFRNQVSAVYNDARKSLFMNKAVSKFVPALQYSGILDTRIRDSHRQLDGLIYEKRDPIWKEIYPPNGHNCRCLVIPVTSNLDFEVSEPTNIRADEGFGSG